MCHGEVQRSRGTLSRDDDRPVGLERQIVGFVGRSRGHISAEVNEGNATHAERAVQRATAKSVLTGPAPGPVVRILPAESMLSPYAAMRSGPPVTFPSPPNVGSRLPVGWYRASARPEVVA